MFNGGAWHHINLREMSRSRKKAPVSTYCCCKSQKKGKQCCNRKFRRKDRALIANGRFGQLPYSRIDILAPWDLGGDGKHYWRINPESEWYSKLMRK
jgi:hypothetical protein